MSTNPLTWLEIDLAAVRANVATLKALVPATTKFCAVVKSNAYGHGLIPVAEAAMDAGADWLGVVAVDEALTLRDAGVSAPILVLGMTSLDDWTELARHDVRVTIADRVQLGELAHYEGPKLRIHLKVETGLGRLGFISDELPSVVDSLRSLSAVELEGVSSHFASVEEQDLTYTSWQLAEFERATNFLGVIPDRKVATWATAPDPESIQIHGSRLPAGEAGIKSGMTSPLIRHIAATAAILQLPESHLELVRAGIGIYGLWPSEGVRQAVEAIHPAFQLQPALQWRTRLVQVKIVRPGTSVGYGRTHVVTAPTIVGVLPIGYADGYDRSLSNRAQVLIHGQRVSVIGRVAMNMTMVDLTSVANAHVGDTVTLIGSDGSESVSADDLATWADTINYEIVTRIPANISRRYES